MKIQPIILCGGSGTRLWPVSRQSMPKQFAPILNGKSLLEETLYRVMPLAEGKPIWAVANHEHRFLVDEAAERVDAVVRCILEPVARNTAPAMAAVALCADPEDLLLFLPADHYIPDQELFLEAVCAGQDSARQGNIVTLGVRPTQPHTGYGYIQTNSSRAGFKGHDRHGRSLYPRIVTRFVEKPNQEDALMYVLSGDYYWNAGVFFVQARVLVEALARHAIDILTCAQKSIPQDHKDTGYVFLDKENFSQCRSQSIDYAVLESHDKLTMIPYEGLWSDVGSWNAVFDRFEPDQNQNKVYGHGVTVSAQKTSIYAPHRPVVALGTENILVVDTQDAVLVAHHDYAEKVKDVVSTLAERQIPQGTEHRYAKRPWGQYDNIDQGPGFKVKRITVKPGASISLQLHHRRAEHWIVVNGCAKVTCGEEVFHLKVNESTYIPIGVKHRLENPGSEPLEIIEVQSGDYLGEDDIVRFSDQYGRS